MRRATRCWRCRTTSCHETGDRLSRAVRSSERPGGLTLEILDGDIAAQGTAAIVNAANNMFWMGAGVAGAIKALGGERIEADAMSQGPVAPGTCVVTAAGRLPARFVIHAAVMGQDLKTSGDLIELATRNALGVAEELQLESVSCPALGTGVGGYPVRLVRFVLFGQTVCRTFAEIAGETLGPPLEGPPDGPVSG